MDTHPSIQEIRPPAASGGLNDPLLGARPDAEEAPVARSGIVRFAQRLLRRGKADALPVRTAIVTVQPKTMFSIERTFIDWVNFALLFAIVGLTALHSGDEWAW